ncbi:hypothetical protein WJX73_003494 [Symbiochloris irregularis]|uniref:Uncharacterized protein n=1 Tax=Symbiochloris irregularis TaxID=706552 RepID=A0AAW1NT97_9CHLO
MQSDFHLPATTVCARLLEAPSVWHFPHTISAPFQPTGQILEASFGPRHQSSGHLPWLRPSQLVFASICRQGHLQARRYNSLSQQWEVLLSTSLQAVPNMLPSTDAITSADLTGLPSGSVCLLTLSDSRPDDIRIFEFPIERNAATYLGPINKGQVQQRGIVPPISSALPSHRLLHAIFDPDAAGAILALLQGPDGTLILCREKWSVQIFDSHTLTPDSNGLALGSWSGAGTLPSTALSPSSACIALLHPAQHGRAPFIDVCSTIAGSSSGDTSAAVKQEGEAKDSLPVAVLAHRMLWCLVMGLNPWDVASSARSLHTPNSKDGILPAVMRCVDQAVHSCPGSKHRHIQRLNAMKMGMLRRSDGPVAHAVSVDCWARSFVGYTEVFMRTVISSCEGPTGKFSLKDAELLQGWLFLAKILQVVQAFVKMAHELQSPDSATARDRLSQQVQWLKALTNPQLHLTNAEPPPGPPLLPSPEANAHFVKQEAAALSFQGPYHLHYNNTVRMNWERVTHMAVQPGFRSCAAPILGMDPDDVWSAAANLNLSYEAPRPIGTNARPRNPLPPLYTLPGVHMKQPASQLQVRRWRIARDTALGLRPPQQSWDGVLDVLSGRKLTPQDADLCYSDSGQCNTAELTDLAAPEDHKAKTVLKRAMQHACPLTGRAWRRRIEV